MKFSFTLNTILLAAELMVLKQVNGAIIPAVFPAVMPTPDQIKPEDPEALLPRNMDIAAVVSDDNQAKDYIVYFDKESVKEKRDLHAQWVSETIAKRSVDGSNNVAQGIKGFFHDNENESDEAIKGYFGSFTKADVELIKKSEGVSLVEPESYDTIQDNYVYVQYNTPWGLGRISHKSFSSQGTDNSNYVFENKSGANTTVYILDSGIRTDHVEFTGRVRWGPNYIDSQQTDAQGHGTHIAGIACGHNVGVAKFANIVVVKVIDSQRRAAVSNIIQGVQWIINDHKSNPNQRAVINYSAVGSISAARAQAMQAAVDAGIMVVTAAGNSNADACNYGPANMASSTSGVLTVAALNYTNTPATFSNYGSCVSLYAPGVSILSASDSSTNSYMYMSGTSMSSPYVAGLAAYFWSLNPSSSLSDIRNMVVNYNDNQVQNIANGTPNKLAYNHL